MHTRPQRPRTGDAYIRARRVLCADVRHLRRRRQLLHGGRALCRRQRLMRYRRLRDYYDEKGLQDEAAWVGKRLGLVDPVAPR